MFRFLRKKAVKAIRRLKPPPPNGTAATLQAPCPEQPSPETTTQHLSRPANQVAYCCESGQQEASQCCESIDTADTAPEVGLYPEEYDITIPDISHETLQHRVSEKLGIDYLSEAFDEAKKPVSMCNGYIFGRNKRPMVALVVSHGGEYRWVFFVVDTGSPWTYVSRQVGTCR